MKLLPSHLSKLAVFLTLSVVSSSLAAVLPRRNCIDVQIPVTVAANNRVIADISGLLEDPTTIFESTTTTSTIFDLLLGNFPVESTETFAATYCEPTNQVPSRTNTLQLLVPGITYNRRYWDGSLSVTNQSSFSYVDYALSQGYPTLNIDRIGTGLSSHPDPLLTLQLPFDVRATHVLIQHIKQGTTTVLPRAFDKVIFVGHSFGSIIGNNLVKDFPADADATVLTGFSKSIAQALAGILIDVPLPAALFDPARFSTLPLLYILLTDKSNREASFYYGPDVYYSRANYNIDFAQTDTVGVGEALTAFPGISAAPAYTGKVFILTGNEDAAFCGLGSTLLGQANCGNGPGSIIDTTRELFPNAAVYDYYVIPNCGHCLNYQFSAPDSYSRVHQWLQGQGF
ncbi:hypothetical protein OIDMADRAFT_168831 [Oidiodendron maius Zn]|uniref:AB hydrolase-1 domain-containing protein n=1 Tax=Oidiodendron maius (strain Zn) TaxID=913774 RepID=A0A0C3H3G2_OIDMZ|nr:hypothetical protein OIDMADRAFT_168831 [Oidiodendron maius Zn]